MCGYSAATSSLIRPIKRCWCRSYPDFFTCVAWNGWRLWCGSSPRNRANAGRAASSCCRAWSRSCSSKRCARHPLRTHPPGSCADFPMCVSRLLSGRCTLSSRVPGRCPSWPKRRRFRAPRSSNASREALEFRPWNICSLGAWRWPKIFFAASNSPSTRLPSASATAPPAPSAPPSVATSASPRPLRARELELALARIGGRRRYLT